MCVRGGGGRKRREGERVNRVRGGREKEGENKRSGRREGKRVKERRD